MAPALEHIGLKRPRPARFASCFAVLFFLAAGAPSARAAPLDLPPEARQGLERLYGGDPDGAIALFQSIEQQQPQHPLGFLLEAEARWWKLYCASLEMKWGMLDAWKRGPAPEDAPYLRVVGRALDLANAQLQRNDSAAAHLYAGLAYSLQARLFGLREEKRATARAGVRARAEFLRAKELDPQLADADAGLGLYNYYVDTLSPMIKLLRFFMGIPGGSKKEGLAQLQNAMLHGQLTAVEARFYLAKNLRTYDEQYEQALGILQPLIDRHPRNPIFQLLAANLNLELSRGGAAGKYLIAASAAASPDPACAARVRQVVSALEAESPH